MSDDVLVDDLRSMAYRIAVRTGPVDRTDLVATMREAADEIVREREASSLHYHEWRECEGVIAEQKAEIERLTKALNSEAKRSGAASYIAVLLTANAAKTAEIERLRALIEGSGDQ